MNIHAALFIFVGSVIFFVSCIDEFTPSLDKSDLDSRLVVEGSITDAPGPFRVRLTKSGSIYDYVVVYSPEPVSGVEHLYSEIHSNLH